MEYGDGGSLVILNHFLNNHNIIFKIICIILFLEFDFIYINITCFYNKKLMFQINVPEVRFVKTDKTCYSIAKIA